MVRFIKSVGIQYGVILPGRAPMYADFKNLIILPSTLTKNDVYQKYQDACEEKKRPFIGIARWYTVWNELCGNIVVQQPRSDLCSTCQLSITTLPKLANLPEDEKLDAVNKSRQHLELVSVERAYYRQQIEDCRKNITDEMKKVSLVPTKPLSFRNALHYSFDYAQQVHLPFDSQQVGPLYFLTGYKVSLFGVAIEPMDISSYSSCQNCVMYRKEQVR